MFEQFDGTDRAPREAQIEFLNFLKTNWNCEVLAGTLSCGVGKSAIARALQLNGATIITANNLLIKQFVEMYPDTNYLIGKRNYMCRTNPSATCEDMWNLRSHRPCGRCEYSVSRTRALAGQEPTIYNAISYFYTMQDPRWQKPKILVVDEADKLLDMLMLLVGETFGRSYRVPPNMDLAQVGEWLKELEARMLSLALSEDIKSALHYSDMHSRVARIRMGIVSNPTGYSHLYNEKGELVVFPIHPPRHLIDKLLRADKLILMSATLYTSDIEKLTERPYKHVEVANPVDEARRRIIIKPPPELFNWRTAPSVIGAWVNARIAEYPNQNTIVHVTYSLSQKLKPFIPKSFINTKEDKEAKLKRFKEKGGIWLASGCAEGIDLPDDLCTLNIIPVLPRQNLGDPVVMRRISLPGGQSEYELQVIKTVQQMSGRSTRHTDDYSLTILSDRRFLDLVRLHKDKLPRSFIEQVKGIQ